MASSSSSPLSTQAVIDDVALSMAMQDPQPPPTETSSAASLDILADETALRNMEGEESQELHAPAKAALVDPSSAPWRAWPTWGPRRLLDDVGASPGQESAVHQVSRHSLASQCYGRRPSHALSASIPTITSTSLRMKTMGMLIPTRTKSGVASRTSASIAHPFVAAATVPTCGRRGFWCHPK